MEAAEAAAQVYSVCNAWGGEPSFLAEEATSSSNAPRRRRISKDAQKTLVTTSRESRVDQATVLSLREIAFCG